MTKPFLTLTISSVVLMGIAAWLWTGSLSRFDEREPSAAMPYPRGGKAGDAVEVAKISWKEAREEWENWLKQSETTIP